MVGFFRDDAGSWERFDEYRTPTFFETGAVTETLLETGWKDVKVTSTDDLDEAVSDAEPWTGISSLHRRESRCLIGRC
jgi:hypothetical protein